MKHSTETIIIIAALCLILLFLVLGIVGFYIFKRQGNPLKKLLKEFDKKMWMTIGLGFFFFSLYMGIVFFSSKIINSYNVFLYFYEYTTDAIYIGLSLFVTLSIMVYIVRLIIKYTYHKKNKVL